MQDQDQKWREAITCEKAVQTVERIAADRKAVQAIVGTVRTVPREAQTLFPDVQSDDPQLW